MPKPSGMLALDYPAPNYQAIVSDCPFDFDINSLSSIDLQSNCFFSLSYPSMKAKVYMSYFDLRQHNIDDLIKDFNDRLIDHTRQQARIQESSYESIEQQKYGQFLKSLQMHHPTYIIWLQIKKIILFLAYYFFLQRPTMTLYTLQYSISKMI